MRKLQIAWLLLVIGGVVLSSGPPALGQAVTGSITGYVTDPSGAAIPDANVTATAVQTGVGTSRTTDAAGLYLINNLLPGTYTTAAQGKGVKTFNTPERHR